MTKHMLEASVNMWSAAPAALLAMLLALQGGYYPAAMGIASIALAALSCARFATALESPTPRLSLQLPSPSVCSRGARHGRSSTGSPATKRLRLWRDQPSP